MKRQRLVSLSTTDDGIYISAMDGANIVAGNDRRIGIPGDATNSIDVLD
jgi:hypothetical protein